MSHFTVMVIGEGIEKQLAPFQENNMGDCPREYLEFEDVEDEYRKQYEEGSCKMVRCEDGSYLYSWDERFKIPGSFGFGRDTHKVPDHLEEVDVRHVDRFETFEKFMEDFAGYEARDGETGRYGRWDNPNKQWDWCSVGGRWTGFFKLKPGCVGQTGRPGIMTEPAEDGHVDSAMKRDIDFDGMRSDYVAKRLVKYRRFHSILAGRTRPIWDEVRDRNSPDIDAARREYHSHPVIKDLNSDQDVRFEDYEDFDFTEDEFIRRESNAAISTFAVLKDGVWSERGSMGWWGVIHNESDKDEWRDRFAKLLDELPDDTRLTIVDCHI